MKAVRRWCLFGMCATAGFVAYISLVPFNFERITIRQALETFARTAEHEINSLANFIANIILFVPLGIFGAGALVRRTRRWRRFLLRSLSLAVASLALSFAIEILQAFLPSRTPSYADIAAQIFGTLLGLLVWVGIAPRVYAWANAGDALKTSQSLLRTCLVLFAATRAIALLLPLDVTVSLSSLLEKYRRGGIILNPMKSIERWQSFLPSLASDLLLCAPIGYLAAVLGTGSRERRHISDATLIGVGFVALTELAQVLVLSRTADIGDIVTGALGVVVGAWFATRTREVDAALTSPIRRWYIVGLLGALAIYAILNWTPFDFVLSGAFVRPRLRFVYQIPFYGYYLSPELQALSEGLLKVATGVPIGFFTNAVLGGLFGRSRGTSTFIVALGAAFFSVVELGQAFLPSRYPDTTDVLLALAGTCLGIHLAGRLQAHTPSH